MLRISQSIVGAQVGGCRDTSLFFAYGTEAAPGPPGLLIRIMSFRLYGYIHVITYISPIYVFGYAVMMTLLHPIKPL
jgi:hypothetical protein